MDTKISDNLAGILNRVHVFRGHVYEELKTKHNVLIPSWSWLHQNYQKCWESDRNENKDGIFRNTKAYAHVLHAGWLCVGQFLLKMALSSILPTQSVYARVRTQRYALYTQRIGSNSEFVRSVTHFLRSESTRQQRVPAPIAFLSYLYCIISVIRFYWIEAQQHNIGY